MMNKSNSVFVDAVIGARVVGGIVRLDFGKIVNAAAAAKDNGKDFPVEQNLELLIPLSGLGNLKDAIDKIIANVTAKANPPT